jgi:hypothetical protein
MTDDIKAPGLTVGQLRAALVGVADDMPVTIRARDDENEVCGGILCAAVEHGCNDEPHFAIDASGQEEDFEDDDD